jgi:hypothetical protein
MLRRELALLCIENCKLLVCASEMMSSQFKTRIIGLPFGEGTKTMLVPKGPSSQSLANPYFQRLENWALQMPSVCRYEPVSFGHRSRSPVLIVHQAALRMVYLTYISVLHNPQVMPFPPTAASSFLALEAAKNMQHAQQSALRYVADEILHTGIDLKKKNLIHFLPSSCLTAVSAAALIHLTDIQFSSAEDLGRARQQYLDSASILRNLCEIYPAGEPSLSFLDAVFHETVSSHRPQDLTSIANPLSTTNQPDDQTPFDLDDHSEWLNDLSLQSNVDGIGEFEIDGLEPMRAAEGPMVHDNEPFFDDSGLVSGEDWITEHW